MFDYLANYRGYKMRAITLEKELRFHTEYKIPVRKNGESLVKVLAAGVCNTDIELIRGYMAFSGILGHEFVGVVEESDDHGFIGKRVVGEINLNCGKCSFCLRQMPTHCSERTVLGILGKDGAFAEYLTIPTKNLHVLPDGVSDIQAVFVEPLAAAFEIVKQVHIKPTDNVLLFGDGKLGLLSAQVLSLYTPNLIAIGKHQKKLDILAKKGIKTTLLEDLSVEKTQADIVVDCTGNRSGLSIALSSVRPRGTLVIKSTTHEEGALDINHLVINEISVVGSRCGPFPVAIEALASNRVDVVSMVTNEVGLRGCLDVLKDESKKSTGIKTVINICSM